MIDLFPVPTASASVFRTGRRLSKHHYTIYLEIDGLIFPEIHLHARTKRKARIEADFLAANAGRLLSVSGLMGTAYQRLIAQRTGRPLLPAAGDVIYLAVELGEFKPGDPGVVLWSEWDEDIESLENQYPVMAMIGTEGDQVPLALDDFTTKKPGAGA